MNRLAPLLVLLLAFPGLGQDKSEKLMILQEGKLPIILSAPHGGRTKIADTPLREGKDITGAKFTTVRDDNTMELTEKLATAIEKQFGAKPHVVIAKFERKYLDVNRVAREAYESDKAKPYYEAYHAALQKAVDAVKKDYGRGLLLDIHGQGSAPDTIIRGTVNGKSVAHLVDRFGRPALTGPKSILGVLEKAGYKIEPANDAKDQKETRLNGGHITQHYGSSNSGIIDAIQFELGGDLRKTANHDKLAKDIAEAVAVFAKEYLPERKK